MPTSYLRVSSELQESADLFVLDAPLQMPRPPLPDARFHSCSFHSVFLDAISSRWSLASLEELFQCGFNCHVPTETASNFCAMQSACWFVWFNFISVLLTELLVFIRLSFRCDMDMPTSTLGK